MEDSVSEDHALESRSSSVEGIPGSERCLSGDSLTEWRSSEQVENGNPSTSPAFWEIDDDDPGPRPSDLYGKFTWKIEGFSQVNKRELRSNIFEVGGYKWYILIYPQGCDVCNHLSLFLCVANHDKLLPGWSHFAQFTIAVVNNDSKKSKYSDTLHRFWKKEHDWGWKKFMELSKVSDGFIVDDALVIKAQVQVIREKAHQPFRCLDCDYRRELVRVYLSNVEKLCRRYVEEKRGKFIKIIEDKVRWSSFHAFWVGIDCNTRLRMSCEKSETVLKVVVKHFFIENEVTSTLVMDYLYSGMKALEYQTKSKNGGPKLAEIEEMPEPFVFVEKDVFVLTNDVLMVIERAALEPLPPKDDKGSQNQNRLKEFNTGDDLESIELDERRLTELGRRTVEMFALNHIYSMIEIAYQEAVALRRQEELIREEEAAGQIESELRARRIASEKEKRSKKKQMKQKKNSRKSKETKDKGRSEKTESSIKRIEEEIEIISSEALENQTQNSEMNQPESEERERETRPASWDTDARSVDPDQSQTERKSSALGDDSSSTCSNDSVRSAKGVSSFSLVSSSRNRRKNQQSDLRNEFEALDLSAKRVDQHLVKDEAVALERKLNSSSPLPRRSTQTADSQTTTVGPAIMTSPATSLTIRDSSSGSKSPTGKPFTSPVKSTKSMVNTKSVVIAAQSRPFSAPLAPKQKPLSVPISSPRPQTPPVLSRSVSAAGRIGVDPSQSTVNPAQSYRNAIMGRAASMSTSMSTSGTIAPEQFLPKPELTFGSVTPEKLQSSALTQTADDSPPSTRLYHLEEDSATSSGQQLQAQGLTQDDFPHLDIINDLLNEEYSQREVGANGYTPLPYSTSNERYFFPGSTSSAAMAASSGDDTYLFTMGSQLYEQMLLRESGAFGQATQRSQPFDLSSAAYGNRPAQKQWPVGPARPRPSDNNFYYDQDYLDMVCVMNGFNSKYHPSNGH